MNSVRMAGTAIVTALVMGLAGQAQTAEAGGRDHGRDRHHYGHGHHDRRHHHGYNYGRFPSNTIAIDIGGIKFYYSSGKYYRKHPGGYIHVRPPFGTCVRALPHGYKVVIIASKKYYRHEDIYYIDSPQGYMVVNTPVQIHDSYRDNDDTARVYVSGGAAGEGSGQSSITVNVPNSSGTFTAVTLIRSKGGYIGPQGEFYNEFPKISELKVIYGS